MEAVKIDINDYEYAGEGAIGQSFNNKQNPKILLKLMNEGADVDVSIRELECSRKVYSLGIPTPKPGDFVTDGAGRYGVRFERIPGKISFARAVGNDPANVEQYARRFARMCRNLHSTVVPDGMFPDVKQHYREMLAANGFYTDDEISYINSVIDSAPEGNKALHGDLQFGNGIMCGDRDYFIDLGEFSQGCPLFDLGMVLFTCKYDNPVFLKEVFHMNPPEASLFWLYFAKEYFGEDTDPDEIEMEIRPYAAVKVVMMENYSGKLESYHWLMNP